MVLKFGFLCLNVSSKGKPIYPIPNNTRGGSQHGEMIVVLIILGCVHAIFKLL